MSEDVWKARFRKQKNVYEKCELVKKAVPSLIRYKNGEWQISWFVMAPVLDQEHLRNEYSNLGLVA